MKNLFFIIATTTLISCGSEGDSKSALGGSSCENCITGSFFDSAVSDFEQTSNIAGSVEPGQVSCSKNQSVSFRMTALDTETVNVSTDCTDMEQIEKDIRAQLIDAFRTKGSTIYVKYSEHGELPNRKIDMNNLVWETAPTNQVTNSLKIENGRSGYENCYDEYVFYINGSFATGQTFKNTLFIRKHDDTVMGSGVGECHTSNSDYLNGFNHNFKFRFKNGYMELDNNNIQDYHPYDHGDLNHFGPNQPLNTAYERWVIE